MATLGSVRRYLLHKRRLAREAGDWALVNVWQAKQEAEPGSALGASVPHQTALEPLGYTTAEDLDGADVDELESAGLTRRQAEDVIGALS